MSNRDRCEGVFVPMEDVQAHVACGWTVVDDLLVRGDDGAPFKLIGHGDVVLMAPPAEAMLSCSM